MVELGRTWQNLAEKAELGGTWRNLAEKTELGRTWWNLAELGRTWQNLAEKAENYARLMPAECTMVRTCWYCVHRVSFMQAMVSMTHENLFAGFSLGQRNKDF